MSKVNDFLKWKSTALAKADLSKKGSIDDRIEALVKYLNEHSQYFTTSSCSGRILICSDDILRSVETDDSNVEPDRSPGRAKRGCVWYMVSHSAVHPKDALSALSSVRESCKLKFEPFVLHVQCSDLKYAQCIQEAAVQSGFRNSGITLGRGGKKIIAAVRGTSCLEVPLTSSKGMKITSDEYIEHTVTLANKKMEENFKRIDRFEENVKATLRRLSQANCVIVENSSSKVYRRKRNRDRSPAEKRSDTNEYFYSCSSLFSTEDDI